MKKFNGGKWILRLAWLLVVLWVVYATTHSNWFNGLFSGALTKQAGIGSATVLPSGIQVLAGNEKQECVITRGGPSAMLKFTDGVTNGLAIMPDTALTLTKVDQLGRVWPAIHRGQGQEIDFGPGIAYILVALPGDSTNPPMTTLTWKVQR